MPVPCGFPAQRPPAGLRRAEKKTRQYKTQCGIVRRCTPDPVQCKRPPRALRAKRAGRRCLRSLFRRSGVKTAPESLHVCSQRRPSCCKRPPPPREAVPSLLRARSSSREHVQPKDEICGYRRQMTAQRNANRGVQTEGKYMQEKRKS